MRIAATVAGIAIAAISAGCGGGSSSSNSTTHSVTRTASQVTTARSTATTAGSQTTPSPAKTATRSQTTAAKTTVTSGKGRTAQTVPARLVDQPLDVAERILRNARISYKVVQLHRGSGPASQWGVCETTPPAGKRVPSAGVGLIVVHAKCGAR